MQSQIKESVHNALLAACIACQRSAIARWTRSSVPARSSISLSTGKSSCFRGSFLDRTALRSPIRLTIDGPARATQLTSNRQGRLPASVSPGGDRVVFVSSPRSVVRLISNRVERRRTSQTTDPDQAGPSGSRGGLPSGRPYCLAAIARKAQTDFIRSLSTEALPRQRGEASPVIRSPVEECEAFPRRPASLFVHAVSASLQGINSAIVGLRGAKNASCCTNLARQEPHWNGQSFSRRKQVAFRYSDGFESGGPSRSAPDGRTCGQDYQPT